MRKHRLFSEFEQSYEDIMLEASEKRQRNTNLKLSKALTSQYSTDYMKRSFRRKVLERIERKDKENASSFKRNNKCR